MRFHAGFRFEQQNFRMVQSDSKGNICNECSEKGRKIEITVSIQTATLFFS